MNTYYDSVGFTVKLEIVGGIVNSRTALSIYAIVFGTLVSPTEAIALAKLSSLLFVIETFSDIFLSPYK